MAKHKSIKKREVLGFLDSSTFRFWCFLFLHILDSSISSIFISQSIPKGFCPKALCNVFHIHFTKSAL
ncbi:hypothetical protein BKN38_09295 [Helicobacter sp. CLO-3]|uniref:hypothetical protein n=1 Tax=unclassified Helicobacter TaxID=2593540 RepID=UPI000805DCED|nr:MULTISPECIES: hypothetical protein [unclassified Helicobacter]OBV29925.1 hypothetical protein BA723_03635 [Helicobacter sp. CLO-3]OHU81327.1 hypothetical protein BKN38_09295 [Helicobacter sp. CLO-3]